MHRTDEPNTGQGLSLLEIALEYHRRGWSIIPIKTGTKKPACRSWKRYQSEQPTVATLRRWFASGKDHGLAVILGEVSGSLVCRDFDVMEAYDRWAAEHPDLAETLPTVATARGRHVYFRSDHRGIVKRADGELRGAGYCLLPPSRHPDGPEYEWLAPLPDGDLPFVEDLKTAGLLAHPPRATERTERTEITEENGGQQRRTEAIGSERVFGFESDRDEEVERAILESLPKEPRTYPGRGRRNDQVFDLCRVLKAIPRLADAGPHALEPVVRRWHELGLMNGLIGSIPFEETWMDFLHGWPNVKFPKGTEPMAVIFEQVQTGSLPQAAFRYEQPGLRLLVALCRELQRASGDRPFFLGCRTAGRLLGVDHTTAWRWLFLLQHDRPQVLEVVEKGGRARRQASRYRYLGD